MMNNKIKYIVFIISILYLQGVCTPCSEKAILTKSKSTPVHPDILKSFNERIYKNGGNSLERDTVRLTILRSLDEPIMITWYPYDDKFKNSLLSVKKTKKAEEGGELFFNEIHTLTKSTSLNLSTFVGLSDPHGLPKEAWRDISLDGSQWIFEFASKEVGYSIIRNDITTHRFKKSMTSDRVGREVSLTSFGLMLWILSNNDEEFIY